MQNGEAAPSERRNGSGPTNLFSGLMEEMNFSGVRGNHWSGLKMYHNWIRLLMLRGWSQTGILWGYDTMVYYIMDINGIFMVYVTMVYITNNMVFLFWFLDFKLQGTNSGVLLWPSKPVPIHCCLFGRCLCAYDLQYLSSNDHLRIFGIPKSSRMNRSNPFHSTRFSGCGVCH